MAPSSTCPATLSAGHWPGLPTATSSEGPDSWRGKVLMGMVGKRDFALQRPHHTSCPPGQWVDPGGPRAPCSRQQTPQEPGTELNPEPSRGPLGVGPRAQVLAPTWGQRIPGDLSFYSIHSFIHLCIHSFTRSFIHSLHSFTHSFIHSLTHSFVHSLMHSLTHSFTHSWTHSFNSFTNTTEPRHHAA